MKNLLKIFDKLSSPTPQVIGLYLGLLGMVLSLISSLGLFFKDWEFLSPALYGFLGILAAVPIFWSIEKSISFLAGESLKKRDHDNVANLLSSRPNIVSNNLPPEELQQQLKGLYDELSNLSDEFNSFKEFPAVDLLQGRIKSLEKNSAYNLTFELGFAVVGIGILLYTIISPPKQEFKSLTDWLQWYGPRITCAFFIQLFSHFFLSLYKGNYAEIRFYANELASVLLKLFAHRKGLGKECETEILLALTKHDKNSPLKKDELTSELIKEKMSLDSQNAVLLEVLKKIPYSK